MKRSRCSVRRFTCDLLEVLEGRTLLSVAPPLLLPLSGSAAPPVAVLSLSGSAAPPVAVLPLSGSTAPPVAVLPSSGGLTPPIATTPPATTAVTSVGLTIHAVVGVPFSGDVGELQGLAPSTLPRLKATINWGDSTAVTPGQLYFDGAGLLHVSWTHTYAASGTDVITVSVVLNPPPGTTIPSILYTIKSQAVVTQNSAGGVTITPTVGQSFTGVVGTFSLPYALPLTGAGTAAGGITTPGNLKLTAIISWGDHTSSVSMVEPNAVGGYSVLGTHTYSAVGKFRIVVTVFGQYPFVPLASTTQIPPAPVPPFILLVDRIYSTAVVSAPPPISAV